MGTGALRPVTAQRQDGTGLLLTLDCGHVVRRRDIVGGYRRAYCEPCAAPLPPPPEKLRLGEYVDFLRLTP